MDPQEPKSRSPESLVPALQASGFPFQTAVAALVNSSPGWSVVEREFPWQDGAGVDFFLDLVAERRPEAFVAAIECKKTEKEALIFLRPTDGPSVHDERVRCLYAHQIQDMTRRLELACDEWLILPPSPEAAFCVVSTTAAGKDQRLLERDARQLVRATDAYAQRRQSRFQPGSSPEPIRVFLSVLVTNAPLFVANYAAAAVPLDTGRLVIAPDDLQPAPWVRFCKAFTSSRGRDLGDRTVIVVTAQNLRDLLSRLGSHADGPLNRGRAHLPAPERR